MEARSGFLLDCRPIRPRLAPNAPSIGGSRRWATGQAGTQQGANAAPVALVAGHSHPKLERENRLEREHTVPTDVLAGCRRRERTF